MIAKEIKDEFLKELSTYLDYSGEKNIFAVMARANEYGPDSTYTGLTIGLKKLNKINKVK